MNDYWEKFINSEKEKKYFLSIEKFLEKEYQSGKLIYPEKSEIFNSLIKKPEEINVIILGQDPYHGENQAHGLSFSVKKNVKIPPSLKNIFKEIEQEFNIEMSKKNGNLIPWSEQGVLLLNSILTVEKSKPGSHKNIGWEIFTDKIIKNLSENFEKKVFMLWGSEAIKKEKIINKNNHLILKSAHPSPLSCYRGFMGNGHFKIANQFLKKHKNIEVDWKIKD